MYRILYAQVYAPDSYPGSWLKIHWRMMRLPELYLNYAEAAIENGNWKDAVDAIKPIRDRVKDEKH